MCTSGYLHILHPLKQWPAQVSIITPASLSQASSPLASLGEITDRPAASGKMSLPGREQWACFLMMGCEHPTLSCLLWALTLGPAFYLPCDGGCRLWQERTQYFKVCNVTQAACGTNFWMHKTREKHASCRPQAFGGVKYDSSSES